MRRGPRPNAAVVVEAAVVAIAEIVAAGVAAVAGGVTGISKNNPPKI